MNSNNKHSRLPGICSRILKITCPPEIYEEVHGDLEELYRKRLKSSGKIPAALISFFEVLAVVRLKRINLLQSNEPNYDKDHFAMLKHYLKITLRTLAKRKGYSFVNIAGLTAGLTCVILIFLWVNHEISYDNFHVNSDRIAKISMTWVFGDTRMPTAKATTAPGPLLKERLPYVNEFVRLKSASIGDVTIRSGDQIFKEDRFYYADSAFFRIFTFPMVAGNPDEALAQPNTVVITEQMANKYFGNTNPIGKTLSLITGNTTSFEITGIVKNPPDNSHIQFDFLASFSSLPEADDRAFSRSSYHTYLLLNGPNQFDELQADVNTFLIDYFGRETNIPELGVFPFKDIYLNSPYPGEISPGGDIRYVFIFSAIAVFVLVIAAINYMNLATARAVDRAREVGLRKTLGAVRGQLSMQFLGESILISLISLLGAYLLAQLVMPLFNQLTGKQLVFDIIQNPELMAGLLAIGLTVGLMAGSYPALVLSRFNPASVLKGSFTASDSGKWLRKGLIVFQFAISIFLIAGTLVIYQQLDFIQNKKLGYDKERIVVLPLDQAVQENKEVLKSELNNLSSISRSTIVSHIPVGSYGARTFNSGTTEETRKLLNTIEIDEQTIPALGIELVAGSNVQPGTASIERLRLLLNESAVKLFGWSPEEALGKNLNARSYGENISGTVSGVVKDFNYASLHKSIEPLVLVYIDGGYTYQSLNMMVRMNPGNISESIEAISTTWNRVTGNQPFTYTFLDQEFDRVYRAETRTGMLFSVFAVVAIVIACMGLVGLASFITVKRAKEIGIRKVLGATVSSIVALLSKEFTLLVVVAFAIGAPISWWAMNQWLTEFAFRISFGWQILALSGTLALLFAVITLSYHTVKAALKNPVESLNQE